MDTKKFLSLLLSINLSLTLMGCSKIDTNTKDYSLNQIEVVDDNLTDVETDLDLDFNEPLVIINRPYEFVIDYRYLDVYDNNKVKISKIAFEKDYSTKKFGKKNQEFFKRYCLEKLQIESNYPKLYENMNSLLESGAISIDMNAKKFINTEDSIYLLRAEITFNKDFDDVKKGDTIEQKYILSSEEKLLAFETKILGETFEKGSINDTIMNLDLIDFDTQSITWEDIPVVEEYLYFSIDNLKKSKKL